MFISCGKSSKDVASSTENDQNFYFSSREGDLYRIPLIEPIQVISTNGIGSNWILELPYQQVKNKKNIEVSSVSIVDSLIIVYSKSTYFPGTMTEAWLLINTKAKTENVYQIRSDYENRLTEIGIKEPQLRDVNQLYLEFKQTLKLRW